MTLALAINECEDKLICDFAETYHILNYKELSPTLAATLLIGLRDNSRVKMHFGKTRITLEEMLLAFAVDTLNYIAWTYSKDARKGKKYKGKSIREALMKEPEEKEEFMAFDSVEEYEEFVKKKKEALNG